MQNQDSFRTSFLCGEACHEESGVNAMDLVNNSTERPTTGL